jgi:hypothetical protein
VALVGRPALVPDPPGGLLVASKALWDGFWRSEVAGADVVNGILGG